MCLRDLEKEERRKQKGSAAQLAGKKGREAKTQDLLTPPVQNTASGSYLETITTNLVVEPVKMYWPDNDPGVTAWLDTMVAEGQLNTGEFSVVTEANDEGIQVGRPKLLLTDTAEKSSVF